MTATHYGVQVRVYLDSVGAIIQQGVDRTYSLKMLETGTSFTDENGKVYSDPIGISAIDTTENMRGHSAGLSLMMGTIGSMLRTRVECQDCLRIEANTGAGWRCLFDGFISGASWSRTSTVRGYSWRLQLHAEGLQRLFQQGWLNWRGALAAGASDILTAQGIQILNNLTRDNLFTNPQKFIGMLLNFGVSDLMGLTGRDGNPIALNQYWQLGNYGATAGGEPDFDASTPIWTNSMGLQLSAVLYSYLEAEGPLWQTIVNCSEPELHELFVTYLPLGGDDSNSEVPTVVFRPIPFPGQAGDPAEGQAMPAGMSYPDDSGWSALPVLLLGGTDGPAPLSVSASKSDAERKNMFVWSMSTALDGDQNSILGFKMMLGYYLDQNSLRRYGFCSDQITTNVYDRKNADWLGQQIPRVLGRAAFQRAALPYLWTHQRHYPLLPGARAGTVLQDSTDGICGYITSVSHQIQAGDPGSFRAATTLQVERVVEGADAPVTQSSYPDAVREYLWDLQHFDYKPEDNPAIQAIVYSEKGNPTPAKGFNRVEPWTGAIVVPAGGGLGALRMRGVRCGVHKAVDYSMPVGTPLVAPCDGQFLGCFTQKDSTGNMIGAGQYVRFLADDGTHHMFAHLSVFPTLAAGARVLCGVTGLGVTGITGHTTGPHLHWQVLQNLGGKDRVLDPQAWLAGQGAPL